MLRQELAAPVFAIALERPPLAAALSNDAVWMQDAKGWRSEKLPSVKERAATHEPSLFFGRDYRVRLLENQQRGTALENFYYRWLPGGFRSARDEIGRLAARRAGRLVAVLGTVDPEVVCVVDDVCIIKRVSGWTTLSAPPELSHVAIQRGEAWALAGRQLLRLTDGWQPVGPSGAFESSAALCVLDGSAWVLESELQRVHHFDGNGWRVLPSPVGVPRALWGSSAAALWLAGDEGLAKYESNAFRRMAASSAPLVAIAGRHAGDVWVGGPSGLFRLQPTP